MNFEELDLDSPFLTNALVIGSGTTPELSIAFEAMALNKKTLVASLAPRYSVPVGVMAVCSLFSTLLFLFFFFELVITQHSWSCSSNKLMVPCGQL